VVVAGEVLDIATAQRRERIAVPGLALAVNLAKLDRAEALSECPEGAAGVDLGKLSIIADEHELRLRAARGVRERRVVAGADHAGFVDDQHRTGRELDPARAPVAQARDGRRATPAWSRSSHAARAESAQPRTGTPLFCHAWRAASGPKVLPVPAAARTT